MEGHLEYISISVNLKTEVISTTNQNIGKYHEESMGTQEQCDLRWNNIRLIEKGAWVLFINR